MGDKANKAKTEKIKPPGPVTVEGQYDLSARSVAGAGPRIPYAEKIYTDEEVTEMIEDCIDLPRKMWPTVQPGSQLRFIKKPTKDDERGKFLIGGKVVRYTAETNSLLIISGKTEKITFPIYLDEIDKVYLQYYHMASIEIGMLVNSVKELNKQVKELRAKVAKLERK